MKKSRSRAHIPVIVAAALIGGRPGRAFTIEEPARMLWNRFLLVDDRIYTLSVAAPTGGDPEQADKFFDSFALTK